ncbi:SDR family oxidoreductase [[Clostridium] polysaccharolyticum]|uniref:SDR family oxidoreductase n=1 Tax=[Clostridium] polysaccharolyticum TaxID=29364 RepID=UPI00115F86CC
MAIITQPEEMANAILFLISDDSIYITGNILDMAGGFRMKIPQFTNYILLLPFSCFNKHIHSLRCSINYFLRISYIF